MRPMKHSALCKVERIGQCSDRLNYTALTTLAGDHGFGPANHASAKPGEGGELGGKSRVVEVRMGAVLLLGALRMGLPAHRTLDRFKPVAAKAPCRTIFPQSDPHQRHLGQLRCC